jgi:alpha-L-fucosidase
MILFFAGITFCQTKNNSIIDHSSERLQIPADQNIWNPGIISNYEFYISNDNAEWKLADAGEFSNIKNNPLWRAKRFSPVKARYIKFRGLRNIDGNDEIGYAEVDVITN